MKTKAMYAGSFDPITLGHLDIITRASKYFDTLVVAVVENPNKKCLFTIEERVAMMQSTLYDIHNVEIVAYSGLLADFVNDNDIQLVVRGLRNVSDFESEMNMSHINSKLYNNSTDTFFLMTLPEYSFISSGMVKEVASLGGDISGFVPFDIINLVYKKYGRIY